MIVLLSAVGGHLLPDLIGDFLRVLFDLLPDGLARFGPGANVFDKPKDLTLLFGRQRANLLHYVFDFGGQRQTSLSAANGTGRMKRTQELEEPFADKPTRLVRFRLVFLRDLG